MTQEEIEKYSAFISEMLKKHLRKSIGMQLHVYPAQKGGVVEVTFGKDLKDKVVYEKQEKNVNDVLRHVPQKLISGDINQVKFLGTNISLEGNRILFIKGEDSKWDRDAATEDVNRVLNLEQKTSS